MGNPLRQMKPVGAERNRQTGIVRNQQPQPASPCDLCQLPGKRRTRFAVPVTDNDGASVRQPRRRGDRIRQTKFIRHQDQRRQTDAPIEAVREPC